jgi:predicted AlkP superfamily pyrophosphatase or phosphodiesterase
VPLISAFVEYFRGPPTPPSFRAQACALPRDWLTRIKRGYYEPRSGHISIVPRHPMYMASGAGGWSHSGPWPYLQDVPLVFYGPGVVPAVAEVSEAATMADVAPTIAALAGADLRTEDGAVLNEVVERNRSARLIVTIVWDGGGWNVLRHWESAWPNLARFMAGGVSFTRATDGSSPSVTPAVHTTLGTGYFPWKSGVTDVPVLDDDGEVADAFLDGESSRFMEVPAFAETWDEANDNRALVGMVGYEPWHLGMIGMGAERAGGDKDDAVWLDRETNEWISNEDHYTLPAAVLATTGLDDDLARTDAADGRVDGSWHDNEILDDPDRIEEVPGFMTFQTRAIENLVAREGYGDDRITDLIFTNYKQIDRNGHYYNMAAPEVEDSLREADAMLGRLERFLDGEVGRGRWVIVVTADHGQQPDEDALDSYGIAPKEMAADIEEEFGDVVQSVWPTQVFLDEDALEEDDVAAEDIAEWLYNYTIEENETETAREIAGSGRFSSDDRVLSMAIPARLLPTIRCDRSDTGASPAVRMRRP